MPPSLSHLHSQKWPTMPPSLSHQYVLAMLKIVMVMCEYYFCVYCLNNNSFHHCLIEQPGAVSIWTEADLFDQSLSALCTCTGNGTTSNTGWTFQNRTGTPCLDGVVCTYKAKSMEPHLPLTCSKYTCIPFAFGFIKCLLRGGM